jgi:hypothetical protein
MFFIMRPSYLEFFTPSYDQIFFFSTLAAAVERDGALLF